jgi:DNA-directed RNA polymerase subunit K/omega
MGACAITNRSRQLNDKAQTIVDEKGDLAVMREVSLREHAAAKNLIYEVHALTEHQFDRCHLMLN